MKFTMMRYPAFLSLFLTCFHASMGVSYQDCHAAKNQTTTFEKKLKDAINQEDMAYLEKHIQKKNVNLLTIKNKTLLYWAVKFCRESVIDYLLAEEALVHDAQGRTALEGLKKVRFSNLSDDENSNINCQVTVISIIERLLAHGSDIPSDLPDTEAVAVAFEKHEICNGLYHTKICL